MRPPIERSRFYYCSTVGAAGAMGGPVQYQKYVHAVNLDFELMKCNSTPSAVLGILRYNSSYRKLSNCQGGMYIV